MTLIIVSGTVQGNILFLGLWTTPHVCSAVIFLQAYRLFICLIFDYSKKKKKKKELSQSVIMRSPVESTVANFSAILSSVLILVLWIRLKFYFCLPVFPVLGML